MSDRIPESPPLILSVAEGIKRPLWSVMIPAYNCSKYLRQNLEMVLSQDPGEELMQIEVIDDCSTDEDVKALVSEIGKGRISYFCHEKNKGSLRSFESCLNRSKGYRVHILHGDDYIEEGFYKEIDDLFNRFPSAGAAFTGYTHVNDRNETLYYNDTLLSQPGIIDNWLSMIAQGQKIQPPAIVVKREVYEQLGGFFAVHYGEDWEMWVRIAAHFPFAHSPRRLAFYRIHYMNITSRYFLSGQNIKDIEKVINIIQHYLPSDKKNELRKLARKHYSIYFARTADMVYHGYKNPRQACIQALNAWKMNINYITTVFLVKMYFKRLIRYKLNGVN